MRTSVRAFVIGLAASSLSIVAASAQDYSGQDLTKRDFSNKTLTKANFEDSVLNHALFVDTKVTQANFQGADLTSTEFTRADLTGSDFRGATVQSTLFFQSTMNECNLEKIDFKNLGLSGVKLRKANLKKSKGFSTVIDVDFSEADLRGANLVNMSIIGTVRFRKAKYDSETRWPKGFDVEESGAVLVEEEEKPEEKPKPKQTTSKPAKNQEQEFSNLDTNEDGRLSGKEMKGLEELDKNKDGRVTLEEFLAGKSD